jgi:hypothetical protein
MDVEKGPNVLFCMPNLSNCILLVSVTASACLHHTGTTKPFTAPAP